MFENFYSIMNPALIEARNFPQQYTSNSRYGFVVMQVNVKRVETGDSLVYMPSFLRSDALTRAARAEGRGLYEYGTDTPAEVTFVNYFDGLYPAEVHDRVGILRFQCRHNEEYRVVQQVAGYIAEYTKGYLDASSETKNTPSEGPKAEAFD